MQQFLEEYYISPPEPLRETIAGIYADRVTSYGKNYSRDEILDVKLAWFARWKSWNNSLVLDSLNIKKTGPTRAVASFDMTYESQYEYEINPIHIYGIRGLYLVKVMEEEGVFFNTKRDAIAYADQAVKVFFINFD